MALKLTVVCDWDWSFSTKMFVGLTALIFPVVPGPGARGGARVARLLEAPAVVPVEFDFPLLPQAAASTTTPRATAGIRSPVGARTGERALQPLPLGGRNVHRGLAFGQVLVGAWTWVGFIGQSPRKASMGASRAARLAG